MKTCCFTGHRKLSMSYMKIKTIAKNHIVNAIADGYTHFISGGAIGFDMLVAEVVIDLKKDYNITLEIAIPFPEQSKTWNMEQQNRYENILKFADIKTVFCNSYHIASYQRRNEYMVNNASRVIAYFDGSNSGTKNTVEYAKRLNKELVYIDLN